MGISYKTTNISSDEFQAACDLVNAERQLSIVLTEARLREVDFVVIATLNTEVVGVSCIKKQEPIAEIGYTAVCPNHRRMKIGMRMTQLIIDHAMHNQIDLACGIVYESNMANRKKLEKIGFFEVTKYLSKAGDKMLCWYCHPLLKSESEAQSMMISYIEKRKKNRFKTKG